MAQKEPFPIEAVVICGTFFGMMVVGWLGYPMLALVLLGACLVTILWTAIRYRDGRGDGGVGVSGGGSDGGGAGDGGAGGGGGE